MNIMQRFYIASKELLKARSPRLVQRDIIVTNKDGTTFQKKVWVLPSELKAEAPKHAQFDLFDSGPAPKESKKPEAQEKPGSVTAKKLVIDDGAQAERHKVFNAMKREGWVQDDAGYEEEFRKRVAERTGKKEQSKEEKQAEREVGQAKAEGDPRDDIHVSIKDTKFQDYGSWSASGKHMAPAARAALNQEVAAIVLKNRDEITQDELTKVRRYSGFGGVKAEDERGVLYDFYTSPPVARMTWKLLDKIDPIKATEKILEPSCGTGVFFETAPKGLVMEGVELDSRTAAVASILQPAARIHAGSFEQFNLFSAKGFGRIVGNAPFGDRSVTTSFMDLPEEKSLDRYFIQRSLDALADGGSMAMIVHPGVMDSKGNEEWRAAMLRKGQFMGAVRLPDKSFKHTQTSVQPDIVFFRKYPAEVAEMLSRVSDEDMKTTGFWHDGWVTGSFYKDNPNQILGELREGAGNWGSDVVNGDLSPENMDAAVEKFRVEPDMTVGNLEKLRETASKASANKPKEEPGLLTESEAAAVASKTLLVGATKTDDGKLYRLNENHRWERVKGIDEIAADKLERVKAIAAIVKSIRDAMHFDEPVDDMQVEARRLIQAYRDEYGSSPDEDKDIRRILNTHAAIAGVYEGLVGIDSDVLTKQNVYEKEISIVDGHNPAVSALLSLQHSLVDGTPEEIKRYFPNQAKSLLNEMNEHKDIFLTAEGVYQLREDFISGDAWAKIDALKEAIEKHKGKKDETARAKWEYGIKEMEKAAGWTPIEEAEFMPQSSWIPEEIIDQWVRDPNGMGLEYLLEKNKLGRSEDGKWGIIYTSWHRERGKSYGDYTDFEEGDWSEYAHEIIYFLNMQKQRSRNISTEDYNKRANDNFKNWVSNNPETRAILESLYNRKFNGQIAEPTKTYSVNIDGWNPNIVLGPHQWQTIHHLYRQGKGISALGTGFGKTLAAIGLMGLLRQEGKAKRFMVQVPNNKVKDWVKAIGKALPGLKVGAVDPESEGYSNQVKRYKMYQDLANGDSDVIVLPESSASEIQLRPENDAAITDGIVAAQTAEKSASKSARKREQVKETARGKLANGKTNITINFEDLGCDAIFIDECHNYKNLFASSLSRETGMNDGRRSDRAMSLFKKNEYIRENHEGKNVFMLTATPLTNSPLEYYNMLMHVAPEELERLNIATIDDFIQNFADIEVGPKYDWSTGQAKEGKMLKGFRNLRSLQEMFFKYTDLQNDPTAIGLKKPSPNNVPNVIPMQADQTGVLKDLSAQLEEFKNLDQEQRMAKFGNQNYLTFYSKMRTASLDLELYNPAKYKGWKNPKLEKLADNAWESYQATGGGQVVFCDRVMSGDATFNIHDKIKAQLVAKGFKESEIAVVNGFTKSGGKQGDSAIEKEVSAAIAGFNSGKYKAIIGTTQTLGEGVNLQKNSAALHHFDIPYRPSDFIQRNGRIDRQGNKQSNVALHTYLTAGTIDNYSVGLVQGKANWIDQLLKTKSNVFMNPNDDSFVDPDELLLALTEAWGDAGKAGERREEMNRVKSEKIKEANAEKVHSMLSALSMMRGSLRGFTGDKGTIQYQNRIRKMHEIEDSLRSNSEFKNRDILEEDGPDFLYNKGDKRVYRVGDAVMGQSGVFIINSINHAKQSMSLKSIEGYDGEDNWATWSAASGLKTKNYYSDTSFKHVPRPTTEAVKDLADITKLSLYLKRDDEFKKDHYLDLLQYSPAVDEITIARSNEDGNIKIERLSSWRRGNALQEPGILNPYDPADAAMIKEAARQGKISGSTSAVAKEPTLSHIASQDDFDQGARKKFKESPDAPAIEAAANTYWTPVRNIKTELSEYELRDLLEESPDYEVQYGDDSRHGYGYHYRIRPKTVEKSIRTLYRFGIKSDKIQKKE
ncbi:MAG: hypothetical protein SAMD01599839_07990 [Rectinema sp.]